MAGRKPVEIDLAEVERLAGLGLTEGEICDCIGISQQTLIKNKHLNAELVEAIKRGKSQAHQIVANKLFNKCLAEDMTAIIWYEKTRHGMSDRVQVGGDDANPFRFAFERFPGRTETNQSVPTLPDPGELPEE